MSDTAKDILLTDEEMEAFLEQRFGENNLANRQYFMDVAKAQLLKAAEWADKGPHSSHIEDEEDCLACYLTSGFREAAETDVL